MLWIRFRQSFRPATSWNISSTSVASLNAESPVEVARRIRPFMAKLDTNSYQGLEPVIGFDLVRATEAAALHASQWMGKGDKEAADQAACDAIRGMFDLIPCCAEVVIGEGIKDNAPGIFFGEQLGTWKPGTVPLDIAI